MITDQMTIETDDGPMETSMWCPKTGAAAAGVVVVLHDGPGLRQDLFDIARDIAGWGYYTVLPDLYYRTGRLLSFDFPEVRRGPGNPEYERLREVMSATTVSMTESDVYAIFRHLEDIGLPGHHTGTGVLGFCHTARAVIRVMAEHPDEVLVGAILHPSQCVTGGPDSPHLEVARIRGKVYAAFGQADHVAPFDQQAPLVAELLRPEVDAEVDVLPGADHGYAFRGSPAFNVAAADRSWHQIQGLLGRLYADVE